MEEKTKFIGRMDKILLAGSLILIIFIFFFASGLGKEKSADGNILFSFRSGSVVLIDKNLNFESPEKIEVADNLVINLDKGVYYWKIEDAIPQEDVVQLNIEDSSVSLGLKKSDYGYDVVNFGNATLNVDIYSSGKFSGRAILDRGIAGDSRNSKAITIGGEND